VFIVLLATASLHTLLVAGQREIDRVDNEIRSETRRNQALELEVAELESPERIVNAARGDGMIDPGTVTWLSPRPDGGADQSVSERPAAPDPQGSDAGGDEEPVGGSGDARAGGSATGSSDETAGGGDGSGGHEGDGSEE
jgi:hypothetical protein